MKPLSFCTVSDDWTYKNMRVVFLENSFLRVGILAGRGSDIFEFTYKPAATDLLLRLNKGIKNPAEDFTQMRNTTNQFEDYYYGGWQEVLPNSPPLHYRGAALGLHGDVSLIPWKYAIVKNTPDEVAVKFWTTPLRLPLLIEKVLSLKKDAAVLTITEELTNQGNTHLDVMWGHHIAFGLPFLTEGALIETNAVTMEAEASIEGVRRFKPGKTYRWPLAENAEGQAVDASSIPPVAAPPYSELCYLEGMGNAAFYRIINKKQQLGFALRWDGSVFKSLWLWQERYASQNFPWWGNCYAVALEPWTSSYTLTPEKAIETGDWLHLTAGQTITTTLQAEAFEV